MSMMCISALAEGKKQMKQMDAITLTSPAFTEGNLIPSEYTCDGKGGSPELSWSKVTAQSYALIVEDPDAPNGTFTHWLIADIPGSATHLAAAVPTKEMLGDGSIQGLNSGNKIGYMGPCPPSGTHRYFFKIYALDAKLELSPGFTKQELLHAMRGHILAQGQLMGRYAVHKKV